MDPCLRAERRQDKRPSDSRSYFSTSEKPFRRLLPSAVTDKGD